MVVFCKISDQTYMILVKMCTALGMPPAQARNTCIRLLGVRAPTTIRMQLPAFIHTNSSQEWETQPSSACDCNGEGKGMIPKGSHCWDGSQVSLTFARLFLTPALFNYKYNSMDATHVIKLYPLLDMIAVIGKGVKLFHFYLWRIDFKAETGYQYTPTTLSQKAQ